jgi:hypothetical protein
MKPPREKAAMTKLTTSAKKRAKRARHLQRIADAVGCPLAFLQMFGARWSEEQAREAWKASQDKEGLGASLFEAACGSKAMRVARAADYDYADLEARIAANPYPLDPTVGDPTGRWEINPKFDIPMLPGCRPGVKSDPSILPAFLEQMRSYQSMGARQPVDTCSICGHSVTDPKGIYEHFQGVKDAFRHAQADPKYQYAPEAIQRTSMDGSLPGKPEGARNAMLAHFMVTPAVPKGIITVMADGSAIAPEGVKVTVDPADERGNFTVRAEYEYRTARKGDLSLRSIGILRGIGEPPHE